MYSYLVMENQPLNNFTTLSISMGRCGGVSSPLAIFTRSQLDTATIDRSNKTAERLSVPLNAYGKAG